MRQPARHRHEPPALSPHLSSCGPLRPTLIQGLENRSDSLTAADAHGDESISAADSAQLMEQLHRKDGAGRTNWMPKRYATPVGIRLVRGKTEVTRHRESLSRKSLVHFEDVDFIEFQPGLLQ